MSIDKIAALGRTPLFKELDAELLRALAERAVERRFRKDELLFVAGEEARGLYCIVEGAVRAFRESADGREQVIHVERAGATIAEVPVFDDGVFPSSVAAETDSTLLFIDKRDVRNLCREHPQIALAALKVLAGRLRRCAELVETLSLREVGQRVARLLLAEAHARGEHTREGFSLTLTNQQIAARVGSVREVVSRALARLHQDGLVTLEGRRLTIPDEAALASYADED
ncbi:MAG TPA: Crp/Fnr family transcriptional regulator [Pyrinomonadaceae bacterium]|jgi:CRP/FNR family transcriptional regulator